MIYLEFGCLSVVSAGVDLSTYWQWYWCSGHFLTKIVKSQHHYVRLWWSRNWREYSSQLQGKWNYTCPSSYKAWVLTLVFLTIVESNFWGHICRWMIYFGLNFCCCEQLKTFYMSKKEFLKNHLQSLQDNLILLHFFMGSDL